MPRIKCSLGREDEHEHDWISQKTLWMEWMFIWTRNKEILFLT